MQINIPATFCQHHYGHDQHAIHCPMQFYDRNDIVWQTNATATGVMFCHRSDCNRLLSLLFDYRRLLCFNCVVGSVVYFFVLVMGIWSFRWFRSMRVSVPGHLHSHQCKHPSGFSGTSRKSWKLELIIIVCRIINRIEWKCFQYNPTSWWKVLLENSLTWLLSWHHARERFVNAVLSLKNGGIDFSVLRTNYKMILDR